MGRADGALYESKKAGRDQGHVHDGGGVKKALSKAKQAKLQARKAAEAERAASSTAATADSNKSKSAAPAPEAAQRRDERIAAGSAGAAGAKEDNLILSGFAGGPKEEAALRDEVTGLPLDRPFYEELTRKLTQWHEGGPGVSIMMVQLDSFNRMRKQHGDEVVNVVLRALAQFLKATVRDADNLARYDEESFAVMLPGVGLDETTAVGLRLEQTVNRCQFTHAGRQVSLSLSIGITQAMSDDNAGRLLLRAKVAKNNAANRGGNQIYLHDGERLRPAAARPGKVAIHDDCRR
jgi:diguanylate cyclase (GGDEF)-like protein